MNKKQAIQIMIRSAKLYHENLEDQKVLFMYGIPQKINKQIEKKNLLIQMEYYEVTFHRYNFLHLTGVKIKRDRISSAIQFYDKCIDSRLSELDFDFSKDGSTIQKLEVLENMMKIKKNATMIGDFTDRGPKLYSQKAAGGVCGCIGFVKDKYSGFNVPNTLLKKDIRDVVASPVAKIYIVMGKDYLEETYKKIYKCDSSIQIGVHKFSEEIECLLDEEYRK